MVLAKSQTVVPPRRAPMVGNNTSSSRLAPLRAAKMVNYKPLLPAGLCYASRIVTISITDKLQKSLP